MVLGWEIGAQNQIACQRARQRWGEINDTVLGRFAGPDCGIASGQMKVTQAQIQEFGNPDARVSPGEKPGPVKRRVIGISLSRLQDTGFQPTVIRFIQVARHGFVLRWGLNPQQIWVKGPLAHFHELQ